MGVSREAGGFELQVGEFNISQNFNTTERKIYRHKICKEENL